MDLNGQGTLDLAVRRPASDVTGRLADADWLVHAATPPLRPDSRASLWLLPALGLGPLVVHAACHITVDDHGDTVTVTGVPADGAVPCHVQVLARTAASDLAPSTCELHVSWQLHAQVTAPRLARRAVTAGFDRACRRIVDELTGQIVDELHRAPGSNTHDSGHDPRADLRSL